MTQGDRLFVFALVFTACIITLFGLNEIDVKIDALAPKYRVAEQVRLCCWYYDIIHDSKKHPKQETWTKEGREMLQRWVREEFSAPVELLPDEVVEWVEEVRK